MKKYLKGLLLILLFTSQTSYSASPSLPQNLALVSTIHPFNSDFISVCGVFGDVWTCPNPHCNYQNYVGIDYCALCGSACPLNK